MTYKGVVEQLRARFGCEVQKERFITELRARRRRQGESLAQLHGDIKRLMVLAYAANANSPLGEELGRDYFIGALGDRELELKVREKEPKDLDTTYRTAVRLEAFARACSDDTVRDYRQERTNRDGNLARKVAAIEKTLTERGLDPDARLTGLEEQLKKLHAEKEE